jgi:hypothetical protein
LSSPQQPSEVRFTDLPKASEAIDDATRIWLGCVVKTRFRETAISEPDRAGARADDRMSFSFSAEIDRHDPAHEFTEPGVVESRSRH